MTQIEALNSAIRALEDYKGQFSGEEGQEWYYQQVINKLSEIKQAFESKRRQQEMGRYKKQH